MTALIAMLLSSDFFYGGQDIGLYLFGAVPCGVFVYPFNYLGKLGLPFTGGDDFNGHNLPLRHFDRLKRSEYAVFKNGLNDLGHAITTLLNCFDFFTIQIGSCQKTAHVGAEVPDLFCGAVTVSSLLDRETTMPITVEVLKGDVNIEKVWLRIMAPNATVTGGRGQSAIRRWS